MFRIAEEGARGRQGFIEIRTAADEAWSSASTELFERADPSDVTGVPTGFSDLDTMTSGLQPGDLVIVAGRPSMGKTAFALNVGEHVAIDRACRWRCSRWRWARRSSRCDAFVGGPLDQQRLRTGRLTRRRLGRAD